MLLLAGLAHADGADPDIRAEAVVAVSPEQVYAVLTDLEKLALAYPSTCIGRWERGAKTAGPGATAVVRYDIATMHRKLVMALINAEPTWKVEFEHAGDRGFITQWTLTIDPLGTKVAVKTLMNPPPWPFTRYYFDTIQPDWQWCQQQAIQGVAMIAATIPPPPPPVAEPPVEPAPAEGAPLP